MFLRRRRLIAASGLAAASAALPRVALGQADRRPSITIAVQQISNSASLEPLREQSNVGSRTFSFIFETLIMQNLMGQLEPVPGLAESWKRLDERTVELALRKGVKFHNGDEMTADDVVFTFSRERMFGPEYDITSTKTLFTSVLVRDSVEGKKLPPEVPAVAKRSFPALEKVEAIDKYTVRFTNRTPDVTLEGRIGRAGQRHHQPPRLRGGQDLDGLGARAGGDRSLQGARVPGRPVADARCPRRLLGRPAAASRASGWSWCPKWRAASTACCPASSTSSATCRPTRSRASRRTPSSRF